MDESRLNSEPAIIRGIKTVGVGKKGSRALDSELAKEIINELRSGAVNPCAKGAFFGALSIKGITPEEKILEEALSPGSLEDPKRLVNDITPDASIFVKDICVYILQGNTLDKESAYRLGTFLFSNAPGDGARGLIASALRMRYETPEEYSGLLAVMQDTIEPAFCQKVPEGDPVIQLAEPFDGVDNSYLITPLLANFIQDLGYRVISLVGRNSGPKEGNTLLELIDTMGINPISGNAVLGGRKPDFGWYVNQENLSRSVDRWVEIRKNTVKRPFLSTLEKFLNPANAKIIITSAFHPPYTEKMLTTAERAGFPGIIVMRNGLEGSLAFSLNRPVKILCSARRCEGDYIHQEFEINPIEILGFEVIIDDKLNKPSIHENAKLIERYMEAGMSGNKLFDYRVKVSCKGLQKAIQWVAQNCAA